jgi:chromosome partitioning protein
VQVISFMNMKGGVGKTTLAVNVAYGLAYFHEKKVLVVDCDPQFNATQYLLDAGVYLKRVKEQKGTLRDIFLPRRPGPVNTVAGCAPYVNRTRMPLAECACPIYNDSNGRGRLDLIPSELALLEVETSPRGTEAKLKSYLGEKAGGYDYVIIDCPPTISVFTQAAILASDRYLVPIRPDPLSVIGLPLLEKWLGDYKEDHGLQVDAVGLVFTFVRGPLPTAMRDVINELRQTRPEQIFASSLSESTVVAESVTARKPVFLYKHSARTSTQVVAITKEFLTRTSGA